jgi:glycosyltransferase involved in cell wall biosynthesis
MGLQSGLLFDPNNPKELSELLQKMLNNEVERKKLAEWGKDYTKNFDVNVVGEKLLGIYNQEIAKKQPLKDN